ncbi:MAG: 16S rRNA (adenine(1518)-N(6)/adenine(1519)-N(6))-dimethyltransferase RsmA [Ruminococcaceae bacterium]|nr:16S rRNA (adenine(1518)-N(6)/adenine(1519)-N(6))-dimethyltransferase RsmA [Oscillospiraceae bacterium]
MDRLSDIGEIKRIMESSGFSFSKALGQNFIVNPSVCPKMAEMCGADKDCGVLEVGPGIGVLTNELCKVAKKVVAVELDKRLPEILSKTLSDHENVKIVSGDIMEIDLHKLIEDEFSGMDVVVCANLPYYITSPVIMKLLEEKLPIKSLTVMVQKEAADRLCAQMGTRACGAVTAAVRYYSDPKLLFKVSAGSFMPPPKVDSAVIRLDIHQTPAVDLKDEKLFFRVIKSAFAQRRKTLVNSVASGLSIDKATVTRLMQENSLNPLARAEQMSLEDFATLTNALWEANV